MRVLRNFSLIIYTIFFVVISFNSAFAWRESDLPYHVFTIGGSSSDGELNNPSGVAIDSQGNVYVSDTFNHRVQKFDSSGNFVMKFGEYGMGDGQFSSNSGITVDSLGNIYVADSSNNRIQKFDSTGNFILKFGTKGSANGQFSFPNDLAVSSNGDIYVTDSFNSRIQKFNSLGEYQSSFGSKGTGDLQFTYPLGIFVDTNDNIYISDTYNHRIKKYDSSGNLLLKFGSNGSNDGNFTYPKGLYVDSGGNIYVSDYGNNRIQKFDSSGNFLMKSGIKGSDNGQFNNPTDIYMSDLGIIYVADSFNMRIQKLNSSGEYLSQLGITANSLGRFNFTTDVDTDSQGNIYIVDSRNYRIQKYNSSGEYVLQFGSYGSEDGQLNNPYGIGIDSNDNIYVVDNGNKRIQKFDSNGNYLLKFGTNGSAQGQFLSPTYLAIDSQNNVYTSDSNNYRIQKFDSNGNFLFMFGWGVLDGNNSLQVCSSGCLRGKSGSGNGQLNIPFGIALDINDNVYVANYGNHRIEKYDSSGNFLATLGNPGTGDEQLQYPEDVSVDSNGDIYISLAYSQNPRVIKLNSFGEFVLKFGSVGNKNSEFFPSPYGLQIDTNGVLFVADFQNHRVQKFQFDKVAPTGSISLQHLSKYSNSNKVSLSLSATDYLSGVYQMRISENSNFSDTTWIPYSTSHTYTLSEGNGLKNIYVQYIDYNTNLSEVFSTNIYLDTQPPQGSVSVVDMPVYTNSTDIPLNILASDNLSGVSQMRISEDSNFKNSLWIPFSSSYNFTLSQGDGQKHIYIQFVDFINNYSEVFSTNILLDTQPPSKVVITKLGLNQDITDKDNLTYYFFNDKLTVKGIAQPNTLVTFKIGDKTNTITSGVDGVFSLLLTSPIINLGRNDIEYFQTDLAGNKSESRFLSLIIGIENFPQWLIEKINPVVKNDDPPKVESNEGNKVKKELEKTEKPKTISNPQTLLFLDSSGKPLDGALVVIENKQYYTNSEGEIRVVGLDNKKTYKAKITHKDTEYETEVLGLSDGGDKLKIQVQDTDIVEEKASRDMMLNIYIGISLFVLLLIFILYILSKKKKKSLE